jgi:hypothetical protein
MTYFAHYTNFLWATVQIAVIPIVKHVLDTLISWLNGLYHIPDLEMGLTAGVTGQ